VLTQQEFFKNLINMQKILLALNAIDLKNPSIHFASYIANLTRSKVIGVFLENKVKERITESQFSTVNRYANETNAAELLTEDLIAKNIELFKNICIGNDARFSVHRSKGAPIKDILRETLFADLVITDAGTSFLPGREEGWPSEFVKDLLAEAKCPVIITPFYFDELNEIIFAYDGTDSAVFAIKQFTYLFPQLSDTKITLLQVLPEDENDISEKEKLQEWLMTHYNAVHLETVKGDAEIELFRIFLAQKNKLLVMGAYGRKMFFKHSTADLVLKTSDIPLFIAHR
jgi:hypothetical protein